MVDAATETYPEMGDAAFASGLKGTSFPAVGGYLSSANTDHPWSESDWHSMTGYKLPIWVANFGAKDGKTDAKEALAQLAGLRVPPGSYLAIDMEGSKDITYLEAFFARVAKLYKLLVYGSADTIFGNPPLNGYWVADYAGIGPFMYNHSHVRATQYADGNNFDRSTVRNWVMQQMWK